MMASLSLSIAGHPCIPNSGIVTREPFTWRCYGNKMISIKQTSSLKNCGIGRKIPEDAASFTHKLRNVKVSMASRILLGEFGRTWDWIKTVKKYREYFPIYLGLCLGGLVKVLVEASNTMLYILKSHPCLIIWMNMIWCYVGACSVLILLICMLQIPRLLCWIQVHPHQA